jgi:hypothetical protein
LGWISSFPKDEVQVPVTVEVRGIEATWDGSTVSFSGPGDSIPSAAWAGPDPERPDKRTFFIPDPPMERYEETGFAQAVEEALKAELAEP